MSVIDLTGQGTASCGYRCGCGAWVPFGTLHSCWPYGQWPAPAITTVTTTKIEMTEDERARVDALEKRVADLERRLKAATDALAPETP
jgi:7-keto-8-aminopelargonate synthetase-like enzyme